MKDIKKLEKEDFIKYLNEVNKEELKPILIDNSTKNDYFIYCRSEKCGKYIRPDWRSFFDKRYCKECVQ